jgi:hypothetical protein
MNTLIFNLAYRWFLKPALPKLIVGHIAIIDVLRLLQREKLSLHAAYFVGVHQMNAKPYLA